MIDKIVDNNKEQNTIANKNKNTVPDKDINTNKNFPD